MTAEQERAAVVRFMREQATREEQRARERRRPRGGFSTYEKYHLDRAGAFRDAAKAIEAGEHIKETSDGQNPV